MVTECSCGPECARAHAHAHTFTHPLSLDLTPSHHAYLFGATGAPISIILPDFDWHTRGAADHD